jgi:hypothetical protein
MKIGFCLYFLLQPTLAGTFSQWLWCFMQLMATGPFWSKKNSFPVAPQEILVHSHVTPRQKEVVYHRYNSLCLLFLPNIDEGNFRCFLLVNPGMLNIIYVCVHWFLNRHRYSKWKGLGHQPVKWKC